MELEHFIKKHHLPASYSRAAEQWFAPLAKGIAEQQAMLGKTIIAGINGAQGAGKSTLAALLALLCKEKYQLNGIVLSMDDFYLTRQQRASLAASIHPLMATRGVPGTHDISLALDIIQKLSEGRTQTLIPRFNKASDDRYPQQKWTCVAAKVNVILLEGWCLGAEPQTEDALVAPVNELEKAEDPNGVWRRYVNQQLADVYPQLFSLVDTLIMLKAPSFNCVYKWRLEQENKLKSALLPSETSADCASDRTMDADAVSRFIQYYQRVTEHLLKTLPAKADTLFNLDEERRVVSVQLPRSLNRLE